VHKLTGFECPPLPEDNTWTVYLQRWLHARGFEAHHTVLGDSPAIVSYRLANGKVHAEVLHTTLITQIRKRPT
jgi:hypothetical protein